jgi:signal transduction histidine kinase/iron only hydrogenase large subunit-like protein
MKPGVAKAFITTSRELCRVCYTCVRECPSKAIRIHDGQAEVIPERCIACGNCVKVCSQKAKKTLSSINEVQVLLASNYKVCACIAPSFPAEFVEYSAEQLVGALRALGFSLVSEVAFGAELVAKRYRELYEGENEQPFIATTCPAAVGFIERYYPHLVPVLAPVVSPMVASARAIKMRYGEDVKIVFVGPCIAKKVEAKSLTIPDEVDAVLTFWELRKMLAAEELRPELCASSKFDPPRARLGGLFPISRGMLETAGIRDDILLGKTVATDGRTAFLEALKEYDEGVLDAKLLEILCCQGCIMGPGMSVDSPLFLRKSQVSQYVRERLNEFDESSWQTEADFFSNLDLSRTFVVNDQRIPVPQSEELSRILARMGKHSPNDELNCGACGYDTCVEHAIAIYKGLAETEMCLPSSIEKLRNTINELAESHEKLRSVQEALVQSEKLASMGQLAAGIAHELNNPLGVVLMYSHLLLDDCQQESLKSDLDVITQQADRCKKIVSGLLHFARQNKVARQSHDIRTLIDKSLLASNCPENVVVHVEHHFDDPNIFVDGDQIVQVLVNIITNALAVMPDGGALRIQTINESSLTRILVSDTGIGISKENLNKIFEPFFTTKQIGKGTGLGLAVAYGIIKMHSGSIQVVSNSDESQGPTGTTFTIELPRIVEEEIDEL